MTSLWRFLLLLATASVLASGERSSRYDKLLQAPVDRRKGHRTGATGTPHNLRRTKGKNLRLGWK